MTNFAELAKEVGNVYHLDAIPGDIEPSEALKIGRMLTDAGLTVYREATIRVPSSRTARAILNSEIDGGYGYVKDSESDLEHNGVLLGPYYTVGTDGAEYCPPSLAIWSLGDSPLPRPSK